MESRCSANASSLFQVPSKEPHACVLFLRTKAPRFLQGRTEPSVLAAWDAGSVWALPQVFEPLPATRLCVGQPGIQDNQELASVLRQPQGKMWRRAMAMQGGQMNEQRLKVSR